MKKRKVLVLVVACFLIFGLLAGCAAKETKKTGDATTTKGSGEIDWSQYLVGFSQGDNHDEWTQMMHDHIVNTCKKYGLQVTVTSANDSGEKQVSDIEDMVTRGCDVILISTYHADVIATAVQEAMDAGVPVIVMSSEIPGVTPTVHISADSISTAELCGQDVINKFPNGAKIIQLLGKEGSVVNQMRGTGFHNVIDKDSKYEVLAQITCNYSRSEALTATEDLLQVYGDQIQVVYAHDDIMALGAIQAIEGAGYKANVDGGIYVLAPADGIVDEVLDAIEAGKLESHYYSTFGVEAVEVAMKILSGEKVNPKLITDAPLITKENVSQYR